MKIEERIKETREIVKLRELLIRAKAELKCECPKWVEVPCLSCDLKDDIEDALIEGDG